MKRKYINLGLLSIFGLFLLLKDNTIFGTTTSISKAENPKFRLKQESSWDKCVLPKYDIWDEEIMPFVSPNWSPLVNCENNKVKPYTELKNSKWRKVVKDKDITCKARCHTREGEQKNKVGKWMTKEGKVDCEILETVCLKNGTEVYGYLHSQIIESKIDETKDVNSQDMQFDVYVILIDSLSFSQAERAMPKTMNYFKNHMEGVTFPYMNKVGDNSRPNGMALWFGKSLEKIDRRMFDEGIINADWNNKYFCNVFKDNETHIFKEFQNSGYKTMLAEDWAQGTMIFPGCVGFKDVPTTHYMRPFQVAYEKSGANVTKKHLKGHLCRESHHTLLEYMEQFLNSYKNNKKFAWIWAIVIGHGSENGVNRADKDFLEFLIRNRRKLENSFVFLLGDHGLRFGKVTQTFVGGLDVKNPLTALSIPKQLRKTTRILDIMKENAGNLQTHYDTRATMLDILKYNSNKYFIDTEPLIIEEEKGHSYIRKQPNFARHCRSLPIPLEYCICQFNSTKEAKDTPVAQKIGEQIESAINKIMKFENASSDCIEMDFGTILSLQRFDEEFKGRTIFKAEVEMKPPSNATFKASVQLDSRGEMKVLGTIERTNKYGKTANCINTEWLRPYCYCKKQ